MFTTLNNLISIALTMVLSIAGQICLKYGVNQVGLFLSRNEALQGLSSQASSMSLMLTYLQQPLIWLGLFLYGCGAVAWIIVLSKNEISFAYPILAFAYVVVTALGFILWQESVSPLRWMGVIVITLGVLLIMSEKFIPVLKH